MKLFISYSNLDWYFFELPQLYAKKYNNEKNTIPRILQE